MIPDTHAQTSESTTYVQGATVTETHAQIPETRTDTRGATIMGTCTQMSETRTKSQELQSQTLTPRRLKLQPTFKELPPVTRLASK